MKKLLFLKKVIFTSFSYFRVSSGNINNEDETKTATNYKDVFKAL